MSLWPAIWLTLNLAGLTTVILLLIATPIAWWLANTRARIKPAIEPNQRIESFSKSWAIALILLTLEVSIDCSTVELTLNL